MRRLALIGITAWFAAAAALGQAPREVSFEVTHADIELANGCWRLVADGQVIKDLGINENDAREALQLVRNLHLNQRGVIGTPRPVLEYWLSDGQAPRGLVANLQRLPFTTAHLRVESWQGQCCLRDARQVLFVFGPHEADAQQALAVLRHYDFNQVAYVGRITPVMMCFLHDPDQRPAPDEPPSPRGFANWWGLKKPAATPMPPGLLTARQLGGANPLQMACLHGGDYQPIDPQQLVVLRDERGWKLSAGTQGLADFGPREEDALIALNAVRFYRFTERVSVGQGPAAFTFFLSNGQAPSGMFPGSKTVSFRPEALTVQHIGRGWMICQNGKPLLDAGNDSEQADAVLQTIQRFQFDTLCQIGEDGRGMRFPIRRW